MVLTGPVSFVDPTAKQSKGPRYHADCRPSKMEGAVARTVGEALQHVPDDDGEPVLWVHVDPLARVSVDHL